jgi:hypothetical protein
MGAIMAENALSCIKKYLQTTDAPPREQLVVNQLTYDHIPFNI